MTKADHERVAKFRREIESQIYSFDSELNDDLRSILKDMLDYIDFSVALS